MSIRQIFVLFEGEINFRERSPGFAGKFVFILGSDSQSLKGFQKVYFTSFTLDRSF